MKFLGRGGAFVNEGTNYGSSERQNGVLGQVQEQTKTQTFVKCFTTQMRRVDTWFGSRFFIVFLFVAKGFDGIESCGGDGGVHAEEDTDRHGEAEADDDGPGPNDGGPFGDGGEELGAGAAEQDADEAAAGGEDDGFDEEL